MKKQKKKRQNQKRRKATGQQEPTSNVVRIPSRKRKVGELGIFERDYPPAHERKAIITKIKATPESSRGPDDWWMLGEYLVYDGLLDEDDTLVNEGIQALTQGANHANPSPACMLDLAWVLMHRGLDGMALPYLERAVELAPQSRDAWSLKAVCHIGNSQRDEAIISIKTSLSISSDADSDRALLRDLEDGKELPEIRRAMVLRKMEPELMGLGRYSSQEEAKVAVHLLSPLHASDPTNTEILQALAHARYALGQYDKATPLLNNLIELNSDHAQAHTMLGLIAKKQRQDRDEERAQYELALRADPDFLLALVNLASLLQDDGEYHAARPLLIKALEGDQNDPDYAIALDLYGSNVGVIDDNFDEESSLHERAYQLDPSKPIFKANHIVSLISAGKPKDARIVFQRYKTELRSVPNFELLNGLIEAYTRDLDHPYAYMILIDKCQALLGWKAMGLLVKKAWDMRRRVDPNELIDFYGSIATFAHHAGVPELALAAWKEGAELDGAEGFKLNVAVELAGLGRHAEALEIVEKEPKNQPRSWTVLGNIRMDNGLFGSALTAYQTAIDKDEKFLLPFSSAIDCANHMRAPWELDPFIEKLRQDWSGNIAAELLLARALFEQGKTQEASDLYLNILVEDETVLDPDEVYRRTSDAEDLSVFSKPSDRDHYIASKAFIRSGNANACAAFLNATTQWPKWQNGDWSIILAELYRSNGQYEDALKALEDMRDQPPPHVTRALCSLDQDDFSQARISANLALNDTDADGYNHPAGRPDAVALAVLAACAGHDTDFEESERLAKEAIVRDPACSLARMTMAQALRQQGREDEAAEVLDEAIKRTPGDPDIISLLIDVLISIGKADQAEAALESQKHLLVQNNSELLRHKLGELIAIAKLDTGSGEAPGIAEDAWPWIVDLDNIYRRWITAAHISLQKAEELQSAAILYVGKVTEKALVERVMAPFSNRLSDPQTFISPHFNDVSRFLEGGRPPSIGGIVRLLNAADRPFRSAEEKVVTEFRNFLKDAERSKGLRLRDPHLINALKSLAHLRNEAAHTEDPKTEDVEQVLGLIAEGDQPGLLLKSLKILNGN